LIGTGQVLQPNVRRWRSGHKGGGLEMTQSSDHVLAGDTVVNHDGEGMRDIAGTGGRADIGREGHAPSRQSPATKNCQVPSGPIPRR
jgi:hypothetical protein